MDWLEKDSGKGFGRQFEKALEAFVHDLAGSEYLQETI